MTPCSTPTDPHESGSSNYKNRYPPTECSKGNSAEASSPQPSTPCSAGIFSQDCVNPPSLSPPCDGGDRHRRITYKCGYAWGRQDMKRFLNRLSEEFSGRLSDSWQTNQRFVFETWWWPLTVEGWATWTLDLSLKSQGISFIEIRNSTTAYLIERGGKPTCHLYAGMFAGATSYYERKERQAVELQCYAMGHDCCTFMIGSPSQVNAAQSWFRDGATLAEIRLKLA